MYIGIRIKSVARVKTSAGHRWFVRRIVVIPPRHKGWFLSSLPCTLIQDLSVLARAFHVSSCISSRSLYWLRVLHVPLDCSGFIITRCSLSPRSSWLCSSPVAGTTCYRRTQYQKIIDQHFILLISKSCIVAIKYWKSENLIGIMPNNRLY